MNLFILDECPLQAAKYNCDSHVCKIILEATQMLALSHQHLQRPFTPDAPRKLLEGLYLPRGVSNHPVSRWARATYGNYIWTAEHAVALCEEYTLRYGRTHATEHITLWLLDNPPMERDLALPINRQPLTQFVQAMPDECKQSCPIQAYRLYYRAHKRHIAKYRLGNAPHWFLESIDGNP